MIKEDVEPGNEEISPSVFREIDDLESGIVEISPSVFNEKEGDETGNEKMCPVILVGAEASKENVKGVKFFELKSRLKGMPDVEIYT